MTWICKNCNSNNDDSLEKCELCGCTEKLETTVFKRVLTRQKALELDTVSGTVIIPSIYNVIGSRAFEDNKTITTVVLHDEVESINRQAFKDCTNLKNVVCEGKLSYIGPTAFKNCRALKEKPTAKSVDESAFNMDDYSSHDVRADIDDTFFSHLRMPSSIKRYYDEYYRNKTIAKALTVVIPIISFVLGQFLQYFLYFKTGRVLVLDSIFSSIPLVVLCVSTVFCLVSNAHVIIRSWKLADDNKVLHSVMYLIISSLFFATVPCIAGFVGIVATSAISFLCSNDNAEKIPFLTILISCVLGLVYMWLRYNSTAEGLFFTRFIRLIDADPNRVKIYLGIATAAGVVAAILMMAGIFLLDDLSNAYIILIPFCTLMLLIPAMAIPGLLIYSAIVTALIKNDDTHLKRDIVVILSIIALTLGAFGIFCGAYKSKTKSVYDYRTIKIGTFSEASSRLDEDIVALDISNVSPGEDGNLVTGEHCKTLVLVSDYKTTFSLTIKTSAEKIFLFNVNIDGGGLVLSAQDVEIKLYGQNYIKGEDGIAGETGKSGMDGKAAIYGKNIEFSGKGTITLVAGNGGKGSIGIKGENGSFFGKGGRGGTGGKGGNSGYVIDCEKVTESEFSGNIILKKGKAGIGGDGGAGGDGGFLGSDGPNGYKGTDGEAEDYCSGELNIDEKRVKRV